MEADIDHISDLYHMELGRVSISDQITGIRNYFETVWYRNPALH